MAINTFPIGTRKIDVDAILKADADAKNALEQIKDLTIGVTTLSPGVAATSAYDPDTFVLSLGIPEGEQGIQGPEGPPGTTDYAELTNVPATFPPSAHTHAISEVTNLQSSLDAKQAKSEKGAANGYASLGADGLVPDAQLPASGGLVFIATSDLSSDATADFTAFDSTKYDAYVFVLQNVISETDSRRLQMRTSSDGGLNYDSGASDYAWGHGISVITDSGIELMADNNQGNAAGEGGFSGVVDIISPHLSFPTFAAIRGAGQDPSGAFRASSVFGVRNEAAAVNAVRFFINTGNILSGTITMYGMVNA